MYNNQFAYYLNLKEFNDNRGSLVVVENNKNIPFEIKRIFYLYNMDTKESRANHANKDTKMVLAALKGNFNIMIDNGLEKKDFLLSKPDQMLYVENMTWKKMFNFSEDCIIMVICSTFYDKNDYILNYNDFVKNAANKVDQFKNL